MALPVSFYSAESCIRKAMKDAGLLQRGDDPDSEQFADYQNRLNEMVLYAQAKGIKLWLQFLQSVTLVAGKSTYVFAPGGDINVAKPTRVIEGYFLDNTGNQRPLQTLAWDDWNKLSNKNQLGQINSYFTDKQAFQLNVSFWLTPDTIAALGTAQLLVQQQQPTSTLLTDSMQLPQEWGMWLHWGLADQISTGQPQAVQDRCEKKAKEAFETLNDWDVEDAPTQFTPDSRSGYSSGFTRR